MLLENAGIHTEIASTFTCYNIQGEAFQTRSFSCCLTWSWSDLVNFLEFSVPLALASHIFSLRKCPTGSAGLCRKWWPTVFMFMSCNFIWGVPFISQTESTAEQARWCVHSFLKNYKIWVSIGQFLSSWINLSAHTTVKDFTIMVLDECLKAFELC